MIQHTTKWEYIKCGTSEGTGKQLVSGCCHLTFLDAGFPDEKAMLICEAVNNHDKLVAENERLRTALRFYADSRHEGEPFDVGSCGVAVPSIEDGEIARAALGEQK